MSASDHTQHFVLMGIGQPFAAYHLFVSHDGGRILMLALRGVPEAEFHQKTVEDLDRVWPAGSPYLVVYQPHVGRMLRGRPKAAKGFDKMSSINAARLAGGALQLRGMERWLVTQAANRWRGEWTRYLNGLPDLGFDVITVRDGEGVQGETH